MMKKLYSYRYLMASFLLFAIFLYTLLAQLSFYPGDVAGSYPSSKNTMNWLGKSGATVAHLAFLWLGAVAYAIPFFFMVLSLLMLKRKVVGWFSFMWSFFTLLWLCLVASFLERSSFQSSLMPSYGGFIGLYLLSIIKCYLAKWTGLFLAVMPIISVFYGFSLYIERLLVQEMAEITIDLPEKKVKT